MFGREPIAWMALIRSAVLLGVLFGLALSDAQMAGIFVFMEALLGLITRSQVTPTA